LGALGTILAFACGGKPFTVMPVVFGCAPVLNTLATIALAHTPPAAVSPFFLAGMLVVAAGAATVLAFGPRGHAPPKPAPVLGGSAPAATPQPPAPGPGTTTPNRPAAPGGLPPVRGGRAAQPTAPR
jgi:hypothetical protein